MNYHIMVQDKFLDSYIEDIYTIGDQDNNIFWFRGNKGDTNYIKTTRIAEYLGNSIEYWNERLRELNEEDNIFVHWYDMWVGELVYGLKNKLFVMLWGAEFFEEPLWHHAHWIYDPMTLKVVKANHDYPVLEFSFSRQSLRSLKSIYRFHKRNCSLYKEKNRQIGRIDFFLGPETCDSDIEKIKKLFPKYRAIHLPSFYDQNFDFAKTLIAEGRNKLTRSRLNLLLGNSATETNNHLDAFEILKNIENIDIYCPLNYGNDLYRNLVIRTGEKLFGPRFFPIIDFMRRDNYIEFLNEMDIVLMFQNRQQAWGNVVACLTLGKPVFLKSTNSLRDYLSLMGIHTYDAMRICDTDLKQAIDNQKQKSSTNLKILEANTSKVKRLTDLSKIMIEYAK